MQYYNSLDDPLYNIYMCIKKNIFGYLLCIFPPGVILRKAVGVGLVGCGRGPKGIIISASIKGVPFRMEEIITKLVGSISRDDFTDKR